MFLPAVRREPGMVLFRSNSRPENHGRKTLYLKIVLREVEWEVIGWIHLAQDRYQWWAVVNTVMKLLVPQKAGTY
jgi:hypothetical protein